MRKLKSIVILIIMLILLSIQSVNAKETVPQEVQEVLDGFIQNLDKGNAQIYYYIDTSNTELYNNVQKYLNSIDIEYKIQEVKKNDDNSYMTKIKISANGKEWKINNISADVKLKQSEFGYVVSETTVFDLVGTENSGKYVMNKVITIGTVLGIMIIFIVILVVIVVTVRKKRSNKIETKENENTQK